MKNDETYLKHILDAINKIQRYLGNTDFDEFANSDMLVDAIVRELEIIGEASKNLSENFHSQNSDVSFRDATDMRNFLIHEYFDVNKKVVWDTCKKNLPALKKIILDVLG